MRSKFKDDETCLRQKTYRFLVLIIFPFWHAKSWESDSLIFGKMWIAQRKRKPYTEKYVYMFVRGPGWVQKKRGVENVIWHSSFDNFSPHMSKEKNWNEAKLNKNMCEVSLYSANIARIRVTSLCRTLHLALSSLFGFAPMALRRQKMCKLCCALQYMYCVFFLPTPDLLLQLEEILNMLSFGQIFLLALI